VNGGIDPLIFNLDTGWTWEAPRHDILTAIVRYTGSGRKTWWFL